MIELKGVNFNYVSFEKRPGLKGSINDLFHRKKIEIPALKQFNLTIDSGEIVGLIGPNGAGKTTLTKLLTGIISPSSGQVRVGGFQPDKKEKAFLNAYLRISGKKEFTERDDRKYQLYRMYILTIMAAETFRYGFVYGKLQEMWAKWGIRKCLRRLEV